MGDRYLSPTQTGAYFFFLPFLLLFLPSPFRAAPRPPEATEGVPSAAAGATVTGAGAVRAGEGAGAAAAHAPLGGAGVRASLNKERRHSTARGRMICHGTSRAILTSLINMEHSFLDDYTAVLPIGLDNAFELPDYSITPGAFCQFLNKVPKSLTGASSECRMS